MNRVLLTGRLTRDPEMRSLANSKVVTQFSLATNEYRGGQEKAEFHVKGKICRLRDPADSRRRFQTWRSELPDSTAIDHRHHEPPPRPRHVPMGTAANRHPAARYGAMTDGTP